MDEMTVPLLGMATPGSEVLIQMFWDRLVILETFSLFTTDSVSTLQTICPRYPTICPNRRQFVYSGCFASFNRLTDGYQDTESVEITDKSLLPVHIGWKSLR